MARRRFSTFSMSFLDVMACGLGAVVLLFVIINHAAEVRSHEVNAQLQAEVVRLEQEVLTGKENLVAVRNSLQDTQQELVVTQGLSRRILENLDTTKMELAELDKQTTARREHVNALQADLKTVEQEMKRLEANRGQAHDATRTFVGEGDRQYLTGLKVGGRRILILVDASASMLDETIVNIIRRRNLSDKEKIETRKWQRAIRTVDWLTTQIPPTSQFQIYTFNVKAVPLIEGSAGKWLYAENGELLNEAIANLRRVVPREGTSLHKALAVIKDLRPRPDNVYLLADSLPTQGNTKGRGTKVSGEKRLRYFQDALKQLPRGIPVNTILFPMEGDPRAASAYWVLAQATRGAFLSPSKDWP